MPHNILILLDAKYDCHPSEYDSQLTGPKSLDNVCSLSPKDFC